MSLEPADKDICLCKLNFMLNIGSGELLVILAVALLVIGPKQLPQAARQLGKGIKVLARLSNAFKRELQELADEAIEDGARERGKINDS